MCCLIINGNNSHLKQINQCQNTRAEIDICKYYRVWCEIIPSKTTIVNSMDVQLKGLKILTFHRSDVCITNMYVMQIIKL